jgi:hypothetical protein
MSVGFVGRILRILFRSAPDLSGFIPAKREETNDAAVAAVVEGNLK